MNQNMLQSSIKARKTERRQFLPSQMFHMEQLTRQQIEKRFQLFASIIPANSEDPCRQRTPYFYRREAIAWARMARQWWPTATFAPLCARFAKSYLATYRQMKSAALCNLQSEI